MVIKSKLLPDEYLSFLCGSLATTLEVGLPVSDGLRLLAEQEQTPSLQQLLDGLRRQLEEGCGVHAAFAAAGQFPPYLLLMVEIGEKTGHLAAVFARLGAYYDKQLRIARTIRSAVAYPLLLLAVIAVVLFVFLTRVLPVFDSVFAQLGATMPPAAAACLAFGEALARGRWLLLGLLAALAFAWLLPPVRRRVLAWCERLFARSQVGYRISLARFADALSLGYAGLSNLDEAMSLARRFCTTPALARRIDACSQLLSRGEGLSDAMAAADLFPALYCRMLTIGVQTGRVEEMLSEIARRTEEDMDLAIDRITGRVEPAIVLVLSVGVGVLLLTILLPLVGLMSAL